jgi:hypothetical protein
MAEVLLLALVAAFIVAAILTGRREASSRRRWVVHSGEPAHHGRGPHRGGRGRRGWSDTREPRRPGPRSGAGAVELPEPEPPRHPTRAIGREP